MSLSKMKEWLWADDLVRKLHNQFALPLLPPLLALSAILALLSWRIWKFTIIPWVYPDDPKEIPYWIPILGHANSFFKNSQELLTHGRNYFGNTREPFSVTALGSKLYILTKSKDVADAYKNTSTLSFNIFVQEMMKACGSSKEVVRKMYQALDRDKQGFPNPHGKPLATLARELHIHQLFPGEQLEYLGNKFIAYFEENLDLTMIARERFYASSCGDEEVVVPLMIWASDFFTNAGQRVYFGDKLSELDPDLTWTFLEYDQLSWQILYQYPGFLCKQMRSARDKLISSLERYFDLPMEQRTGDAWFTKAMEREMRQIGMTTKDIAPMMMTIYWGINTNTRKACFWMMAYVLFDPELVEAIREETKPAFVASNSPDLDHLNNRCPRLSGAWNEMLRMTAYSASVRFITEDTVLNGKILRKGHRVMVPYRQLHFNEEIFGEGVHQYNSKRFIENDSLYRSPSWRPFGGGVTQCPGRYVAKQSVITFTAMVLQRFDIEIVGAQPFPRPEEGNPVLGIMNTKEGEDLMVRLKPRAKAD